MGVTFTQISNQEFINGYNNLMNKVIDYFIVSINN